MDSASLMSIRVIPKSVKEETGHHALERLHHTPYRDEVRLFSCLQRGDLKKLIYELGQIGIQNITVGQMSENDLQQQKYMAVSFITLATRYAIQGGLGESNAYAYSDDFIRRIDAASTKRTVHAAIVDGANEFQLFYKIYVPMSTASIATVTLFYAISRWNGYYWSRMLLTDPYQQPLQVYLRQLIENYQKLYDESPVVLSYSADSLAYAIIICSIIPVLAIYPYIQKYFAKGVNMGGVKG